MKKTPGNPEIIVITGLSGAGKSAAIKSVEDFGGFCVDNMPAVLIEKFIRLIRTSDYSRSIIALGVDIRSRAFMDDILVVLKKLSRMGCRCRIVFLEASESVILRRFSESRHRHPLSSSGTPLKESLALEREKLAPLREESDIIIDTSRMSPHDLKNTLRSVIFKNEKSAMEINLVSFGFKYGLPQESDMVIDTRFLPNPFYEPELSEKDGTDPGVREFVFSSSVSREFLDKYRQLLDFLLPNFIREGRAYLNIGVGCTGGRHRSVVIASLLAEYLEKEKSLPVLLNHRDAKR